MATNAAPLFPTKLLSSIIDLICEQSDESIKSVISDEIAVLRATLVRIDEQIANTSDNRTSVPSSGHEVANNQFAFPPPPTLPKREASTQLVPPAANLTLTNSRIHHKAKAPLKVQVATSDEQQQEWLVETALDAVPERCSTSSRSDLIDGDENLCVKETDNGPLHESRKIRRLSQPCLSPLGDNRDLEVSTTEQN